MRILASLLLLVMVVLPGRAQDTVNRTDASGKKQGFWRKSDSLGRKTYEGRFRDGIPFGEFRYYYPDGKLKTRSVVSSQGRRATTVSFFPNGKKMAEGKYLDEKKDSTWRFYSEFDEVLVSEDDYRRGKLDGRSRIYYPDGVLSEEIHYREGVKDGPWEQHYTDGKIKLRGAYSQGQKAGSFRLFHLDGRPMLTGQYRDGHQDGIWTYFDEKGAIIKKEFYVLGRLDRTEPSTP